MTTGRVRSHRFGLVAFGTAFAVAIALSARSERAQADIQWSMYLDPPAPVAGQQFELSIYPSGASGYPLSGTLYVDQGDPPLVEVTSQMGPYSWTLTALQPGKILVHSTVAFETWDCPPGVTPTLPPGCPSYYYASSPDFSVTIAEAEIDSDGDGCADQTEAQTLSGSELQGGRRDPGNPNDYFNPSHDGQNRVDDILLVVDQYFVDSGNPGYDADADRTFVGPLAWNLGPPDGLQRVDDILNQVKQYFHDCA